MKKLIIIPLILVLAGYGVIINGCTSDMELMKENKEYNREMKEMCDDLGFSVKMEKYGTGKMRIHLA